MPTLTISEILISLIQHVGLIVATGFLLLTLSPLESIGFRHPHLHTRFFQILFFGLFGIIGTYSGWEIMGSIANLRAMGVVTAGLFGGPIVGLGAGLIAGAHRVLIDIGGFTAIPCGLATLCEGVAAGLISTRMGDRFNWPVAALIAGLGEGFHMLLVLGLSRPFDQALSLVQVITIPMIFGNALGAGLFIYTIKMIFDYRERQDSHQAETLLQIVGNTVGYLRDGLTPVSADATARIIHAYYPVAAVSITSTDNVLTHVGEGSDHHSSGIPIQTRLTQAVIHTGKPRFKQGQSAIGCPNPQCPFTGAAVVPLYQKDRLVGTLIFYGSKEMPLTQTGFKIVKGLAGLFANQLELEAIQVQSRMLAHAEIRRLQAQINPHFLFNALNTIAAFCRTRPDDARKLILDLARYTRKNLDPAGTHITLAEEMAQVRAYLAIEKARFGNRIQVTRTIDEQALSWPIPALLIQPLVENAVQHGISEMESGGRIDISAEITNGSLSICVSDNGVGIPGERLSTLMDPGDMAHRTDRIGLANCHQRLIQLYGPSYGLNLFSTPGCGTTVTCIIPADKADTAGSDRRFNDNMAFGKSKAVNGRAC
ncbi:MAG: transcriptional regulator [Deltaproteobacteria bacterium]|nr:MAG: transcriptional regulator [Deltaproteobacteria bacterium]